MDVILFVREAFERLTGLRSDMLSKILDSLPRIKTSKVGSCGIFARLGFKNVVEDIFSFYRFGVY